jgi:uncharacterized membrane protein
LSSEPFGDVHYYATLAMRTFAGAIPYRSLFLEYPPGSIPAFLAPNLVGADHYQALFRIEMLASASVAIFAGVLCLAGADVPRRRLWSAVVLIGLMPLAFGPILLNWFDFWPVSLMLVALLLALSRRPGAAASLLGLATAAKVFPIALLPLVLLIGGRDNLRRGLAWFCGTLFAVSLPFAVLGPGGLRFSFVVQSKRGLEFESLAGSLLIAARHANTALRPPGSREVIDSLAGPLATVSTIVQAAAVLLVVLITVRGTRSVESILLAATATVAALVAFGRVLSPQYLLWLIPLVPLVSTLASALLACAAVMTQLWVFALFQAYEPGGGAWTLVARNIILVTLYFVLLRALIHRCSQQPNPERTQLTAR